ncbi:ABC-2 family transporter protein [Streptomyces sp. NPDC005395]|uniref:ABC transporter permease n=2 Tax=Streptomyces TaxID=1883 RepID=A0ABV9WNA3_9ACTN|nr:MULTISPECIES: ABC-2 family transporter protein [Streptomyces]MYS55169.1 ABC transporter permease [Streptomyces sp. SID6013]MZG12486.1 ABC transporter permease [Streptomyces sp. SID5914]WSU05272.1 ABC-2 family transporter protein [Streptomyces sp. NBC_01124]AZM79270.1 ABC transporter permease [Streptomyces sp. KPB2]MBH5130506.1 ABC-2 family transporter protein [Streptomyces sp. HB-N217]
MKPPTTRAVRAYLPFATGGLQSLLQYRSMFVITGMTAAAGAAVTVFLWRAVYADTPADGGPGGFTLTGITTYLLVAQVLQVLHTNRVDDEVAAEVYRGDVAVMLVRPVSYPLVRFFASLPVVAANAVLVAVPVLVLFALLVPLTVPRPGDVALFALSTVFSVLIAFCVNLLTGMTGFVTTNTWGVRMVKQSVVAFFAGQLVPIALMPQPLAALARWLPFRGMVDGPLTLLLGRYDGAAGALQVLVQQVGWVLGLGAVCAVLWRAALGRLEVLGG